MATAVNVVSQIVVAAAYGVDQLRADGYRVDRDRFDAALQAVAALARLIEAEQVSKVAEPRNSTDDSLMDSSAVAARNDLTPQGVTKAARSGALVGTRDRGARWVFTLEAVQAWEAQRGR